MYGIALTVAACLRAGTRANVAWVVEAEGLPIEDWSDATVFTPGGGKTGSIGGGALDGPLADQAGRVGSGRLVDIEVSEVDALIAGLASPGSVRCLLIPADRLPPELWDLAMARETFALVCRLDGSDVTDVALRTADDAESGSVVTDTEVTSVFRARPQLVVVGSGPIAAALTEVAEVVGWQAQVATNAPSATGLIATLSRLDKVVVASHDLELAGTVLLAALDSDAGYIGSLGGRKMQENRADWLAYRGVTDLSRIQGPAGLDIGAKAPAEIAVSIVAEAIAVAAASAGGP